eukprot:gene13817-19736_t
MHPASVSDTRKWFAGKDKAIPRPGPPKKETLDGNRNVDGGRPDGRRSGRDRQGSVVSFSVPSATPLRISVLFSSAWYFQYFLNPVPIVLLCTSDTIPNSGGSDRWAFRIAGATSNDIKEGVVPRSSSRASSLAHPKAQSPPESSKQSTLHPGTHASGNDTARAYAARATAVPWPSMLGSWTMGANIPPY